MTVCTGRNVVWFLNALKLFEKSDLFIAIMDFFKLMFINNFLLDSVINPIRLITYIFDIDNNIVSINNGKPVWTIATFEICLKEGHPVCPTLKFQADGIICWLKLIFCRQGAQCTKRKCSMFSTVILGCTREKLRSKRMAVVHTLVAHKAYVCTWFSDHDIRFGYLNERKPRG